MDMQIRKDLRYFPRYMVLLVCICLGTACKKDRSIEDRGEPDPVTPVGSRTELTLDSLYYYAKQIYYWNDVIPDYQTFNPRQYLGKSDPLNSYDNALYALTQLKINPQTNIPYEYYGDGFPKYSYIDDLTKSNPSFVSATKTANVDLEGNGFDFGIRPVFFTSGAEESSSYLLFITAVYPGSPAAAAGVKRGWQIKTVNGKPVGASYGAEKAQVTSALTGASVILTGVNFEDSKPFSVTLEKKSYKSSPVYTSKIIERSGKKIGYLAFARFSEISDLKGNNDINLDPVFAEFSTQGITDLVVDLRYNGGGYINTSAYLANLIAPAATNGKKMYTEIFNQTMQKGEAKILANQPLLDENGKIQTQNGRVYTYANLNYQQDSPDNNVYFAKKGSLNTVSNVVFIVSKNTASASELLINSLKPYMNVKLVGDTTFGKPVGFFPVTIENRYDVYFSMFETKNALNEGGYFSGMLPDVLSEFDDPRYEFGDLKEDYLARALQLLAPAASVSRKGATMNIRGREIMTSTFKAEQSRPVNPHSEFNGMIDKRYKMAK